MAGFTFPDDDVAFNAIQSQIFSADWFALNRAFQGDGVVSGLAVTQRGAGANMSVDVASGSAASAGVTLTTGGTTNVSLSAADATNPRIDIIVMPTGGTPTVRAGSAAAAASVKPVTPTAGDVVLAFVYVPAAATQVTTANNIIDKRCILAQAPKNLYRARAHRTATQSIPNITVTKVQLTTEDYDPNGNFDNATNYDYTAPVTGYYEVHGRVSYDNTDAAGTTWLVLIYVNGSEYSRGQKLTEVNVAGNPTVEVSDVVFCTAGQKIDLRVYQSSGGSKNIGVSAPASDTVLSINCVGT